MKTSSLAVEKAASFFETTVSEWQIRGEDPKDYWFRRNILAAMLLDKYLPNQACCLDIGCASGHLCELLHGKGCDVYGVDIAPTMIGIARSRMNALGVPEDHFRMCDGLSLPFENDSFDLVSALDVLPYIEDQLTYILELRRVLRPEGLILASITNRASLYVKLLLVKRTFTSVPGRTFWKESKNLILTGYWSGGFVDLSKAVQARSASALDRFFLQAGFRVLNGFDMYNLRWLDRDPQNRGRVSLWAARRWGWNHFGLYSK